MTVGTCLHELFSEQARRAPDRIAVTATDEQLTYAQLDRRADAMAALLRARGVEQGALVGLCLDRSADLLVGLLGILKAGAAYVPVDPRYPDARKRFLLTDSDVDLVVLSRRLAGPLEDLLTAAAATAVYTDDAADRAAVARTPEPMVTASSDRDLAYVIYTSGSTGTPKGVLIEHRNVVALLAQTRDVFALSEDDVWTLFHSVSFDFSVWEIWGALLCGGRLVVVPHDVARSPEAFRSLMHDEQVTVLSQTPSAFRQLVTAELAHTAEPDLALRLVIFGGERLDVRSLAGWIAKYGDDRPVLVNMYGITETTVHVTHRRVRATDLERPGASSIGRPLSAMTLHLLSEQLLPVPDGEPGELFVGGSGVARGYHNRPELTATRFVTGTAGERLYRSGDRAVRSADGEYSYLGRVDDQVQVRGFRIEPGEVQECLAGHPQVATSVVLPEDYGDGDVRLLAYVALPPGARLSAGVVDALGVELAALAAVALPEHMRPSSYRVVAALPLTSQGKVDRDALRGASFIEAGVRPAAAAPEAVSGTAAQVQELVLEVLQRPAIDPAVDFFDAGATSLAFIRIVAAVNKRFGLTLTGAEPEAATIHCIARCVDAQLRQASLHPIGG